MSLAIALLLLLGVVYVWSLEFAKVGRDPPEAVMRVDRVGIESYLTGYVEEAHVQRFDKPIQVPRGVFIQAPSFPTRSRCSSPRSCY